MVITEYGQVYTVNRKDGEYAAHDNHHLYRTYR